MIPVIQKKNMPEGMAILATEEDMLKLRYFLDPEFAEAFGLHKELANLDPNTVLWPNETIEDVVKRVGVIINIGAKNV